MKRKTTLVIITVLVSFGLLYIYNSPEENYRYRSDLDWVIRQGYSFSWLLFIGNKHVLLDDFYFSEYARSKLIKADIRQGSLQEFLDILNKYEAQGRKFKTRLASMLLAKPKDIELVVLERNNDSFIAMTFALKNSADLPGKRKMLYSIVFRYYQPVIETPWERILRKIANALPLCSSFGTTGRWLVVDYDYTWNQTDYATWYLRNEDAFDRQIQEDLDTTYRRKGWLQEITRQADIELNVSYIWASLWVEKHPEHIDEVLFQAAKSTQNEIATKEH